jgi:hypothetical protein
MTVVLRRMMSGHSAAAGIERRTDLTAAERLMALR